MPEPTVTRINGPDITVPGKLRLPNGGTGQRVVVSGADFELIFSNVGLELLEKLLTITAEASPDSLALRTPDGSLNVNSLVCAMLTASGGVEMQAGLLVHGETTALTGATSLVVSLFAAPSRVGIKIRGADGQTANLQEWGSFDGDALSWVDAAGKLTARGLDMRAGYRLKISEDAGGHRLLIGNPSGEAHWGDRIYKGQFALGNPVSGGDVEDLALDFTPTDAQLTISRATAAPTAVIVPTFRRTGMTSDGFTFDLSHATDQSDYVLHYTLMG